MPTDARKEFVGTWRLVHSVEFMEDGRMHYPFGQDAVGYIVSGVGLYGFLGWLADQWLGTEFLVAVGILLGAVLGIYMTFVRFPRPSGRDDGQTGTRDAGETN